MATTRTSLFIGDSITDCGRRTDPEGLGDGYVRLLAEALVPAGTRVVNRGISGNRVPDLIARWAADVTAEDPDELTVYVGINDTWRRFDSDDPTTTEEFARGFGILDALAAEHQPAARRVYVEPFLVPVRPEQEGWLDDLAGKRETVRRFADTAGAAFLPLHDILTAAAAQHGAAAIAADGVHPTPLGHRLIADAWLAARGA